MSPRPDAEALPALAAFAEELAAAAGKAILPHFRTPLTVEDKGDGSLFDPVTEADRTAETVMRRMIAARFPDHGIKGEEFSDRNADAEHVWVLDPIDGTKSFVIGFAGWGTLVGLMRRGIPILGLMSQPFTGELFIGHGGRAHYRGPAGDRTLKSRRCGALDKAMLTTTSPSLIEDEADLARYRVLEAQVRLSRYGGDCYAYCMVADGHIDLVAETGLKAHDIVPLVPIIEGAGGIVTDWNGGSALDGGRVLAAGDRRVHAAALQILAG
ncbi:MAG: histidinol-phosphatase [Hyphomicrobiales bacterium]|nr:histidinol-phosphatase [Hyphomicrobiales bacterium]